MSPIQVVKRAMVHPMLRDILNIEIARGAGVQSASVATLTFEQDHFFRLQQAAYDTNRSESDQSRAERIVQELFDAGMLSDLAITEDTMRRLNGGDA